MRTPRNQAEPTPAEVKLVERFHELERVTAGYRAHARLAGLQLLVLGAWLAASFAGGTAARARLAVLAAPLAWAGAAWISLRLYPTIEPGRWARWTPAAFWIASGAALALLFGATWYRAAVSRPAALAAAAVALAAVLAVVHVLARRQVESWRGLLSLAAAIDAARDRFESGTYWRAVGAALLVVGAYRLLRFLWLGRRMRALRRELGAKG